MTTKAEAVNSILRKLGKPDQATPHSGNPTFQTTDGATGSSTASFAERFLDTCDLTTQTKGWYFNTEYDVELAPDGGTSKINLPTPIGDTTGTILKIDTWGSDQFKNVIIRNDGGTDRLFDLDDNVFTFSSSLKVIYSYKTRFDFIPSHFVDYMVAKAALELNAAFLFNPKIMSLLSQDVSRTEAIMNRTNNEQEDFNVLETQEALAIRGRTGSTSRRRGTRFP
jgi:hypothetical protein